MSNSTAACKKTGGSSNQKEAQIDPWSQVKLVEKMSKAYPNHGFRQGIPKLQGESIGVRPIQKSQVGMIRQGAHQGVISDPIIVKENAPSKEDNPESPFKARRVLQGSSSNSSAEVGGPNQATREVIISPSLEKGHNQKGKAYHKDKQKMLQGPSPSSAQLGSAINGEG